MRIYALILAVFVLGAHAASINNKPEKRSDDLENVELDDVSDLEIAPAKLDSNVNKVISDIPVAIVGQQLVKKLDENSNDYVPEDDTSANIKRLDVDLENPGLPQRQEHETQNPDSFSDFDKAVEAVKLRVEETKNVFSEELKSVSNSLNTIFTSNEDLPKVQENIQKFKTAFADKFKDLSNAVQPFIQPNGASTKSGLAGIDTNVNIIESRLKSVQKSFENGVNTLSEGVELLAIIREEDEIERAKESGLKTKSEIGNAKDRAEINKEVEKVKAEETSSEPTSSTTASSGSPIETITNPANQVIQNFQTIFSNAINSFTSTFQNLYPNQNSENTETTTASSGGVGSLLQNIPFLNIFVNQGNQIQTSQVSQTQGAQSDDPATARPSVVEYVQGAWQNLVNGGQTSQPNPDQQQGSLPPFVQGIVQYFRPQTAAVQPASQPQGTNETPQRDPAQAQPSNIQLSNIQPSNIQPSSPTGPIQNIIQNNPIVKGIQKAVQRIQTNTSEDKPRDPTGNIIADSSKGHHGQGGGANGDNNDSNVDHVTADEPQKAEAVSDTVNEGEREEATLSEVPEKTE